MSVVVAGALANKAGSGGEAWVRLSWLRGLARLGLSTRFVEELSPGSCTNAAGDPVPPEDAVQVEYFREVTAAFGLSGRASLLLDGEAVCGPSVEDLAGIAETSTLVNISGHLRHPGLFRAFRQRVFVDIDPGFTQLWHAAGDAGARLDGHDRFFTIGENIGSPGCNIPTAGVDWVPVRQPVVLDDWPAVPPGSCDRFTTVATWRGPFGPVELHGRTYGLKVHEFRKVMALPQESDATFELALNIHPDESSDLEALARNGWRLVDPSVHASTPEAFRQYVQGSSAEFSVAQGIYVDTNSGWFSDRTVRYLASGKPVLVQSTGFDRTLPVGEGLVAFRTLAEARDGVRRILDDYEAHSQAARQLAETYFGSEVVLSRFCDVSGLRG